MAESGNFTQLVSSLSVDERQNLLEKLKSQSNISPEPLYIEDIDQGPTLASEERYVKLPWYFRLWYFILSLIKAVPAVKLYEDKQVADIGRQIEEMSPGLYDFQRARLLPAFYSQMESLKEAARFFYTALDAGFNRDKGAFYGFLGSLEMVSVHKKLQNETDPNKLGEQYPDAKELEIRQMAFKAMDAAFEGVTDDMKGAMYFDARSLFCLKELASFLFDRVIMAFGFDAAVDGHSCSASVVRELLINLNNILLSLKHIPPMPLLESLFIFLLQEKTGEPGFDINKEIRALLARAEEALAVIREFNKQVPLTKILRCSSRNIAVSPREISGGEDWFVVYREYWKRHIEAIFADYMRDRRHRELLNSFRYFLKGTNLKILGNTVSDANPDGLPIKGAFSLSFLLTFYSVVFMAEINKFLRPILIDAEFRRKENRTEFTESYNEIIKLEDDIRKFEMEISPSGDFGKRYSQMKQDMSSLPVRRRKIQIVIEEASSEAVTIVDSARRASRSMINILNGIVNKDSQGKYDAISNMDKLSGKGPEFAKGLSESLQKFQMVIQILDDIDAMEAGR
ncbi:DUF5312 domain-containing protein [Leadbettera azotonutricia]|uniref:Uncharacterized protein n=1 Tax=Leadbettera azotonutricia (strain ATCC BAA-888 / DSM 13862 / ZAS-9) TaxID=545695 RepID=F5Y7F4_LEAAZ|nr:DUF5312 domain-containing protein [Leadbettera azotonutricia]AEF82698.1 hypothetical protein TREAZ_3478 [Leadbettera azotonutricia ZAS-9]